MEIINIYIIIIIIIFIVFLFFDNTQKYSDTFIDLSTSQPINIEKAIEYINIMKIEQNNMKTQNDILNNAFSSIQYLIIASDNPTSSDNPESIQEIDNINKNIENLQNKIRNINQNMILVIDKSTIISVASGEMQTSYSKIKNMFDTVKLLLQYNNSQPVNGNLIIHDLLNQINAIEINTQILSSNASVINQQVSSYVSQNQKNLNNFINEQTNLKILLSLLYADNNIISSQPPPEPISSPSFFNISSIFTLPPIIETSQPSSSQQSILLLPISSYQPPSSQ
jgi:hypothetical protein